MTTLARLSLWVPAAQLDAFEAVFERQLAPILQRHGLVESSERARATVDTVFSRLFAFDKPIQIAAVEVPPFSGWLTALVLWFTQCLCLLLYPELFFRHLRGTGFRCG